MTNWNEHFDNLIAENPVVVFMKGTKHFAACGFSARIAHVMGELGVDFKDVDILEDPAMWAALKEYSDWPTSPQIYISGEFIGGCDIVLEMFQTGELKKLVDNATTKAA